MSKIMNYIKNPWEISFFLNNRGLLNWMSDKAFLKLIYRAKFGRKLNLENPTRYTEKLQWLKLYNRKPEYTAMVDKYEVKKLIADKIGEEYVIPNLGVYDSFDDIDFDALPNQFVLKCTHDSGSYLICKDKSKIDIEQARNKFNKCLKKNYYLHCREWPYKNIKPRIIAEEYMVNSSGDGLKDYKFFCFDGEIKCVLIATGRTEIVKNDYMDVDLNLYPFIIDNPNSKIRHQKPECYDKMLEIAKKLSEGIPHVRVDLYENNGNIYFGELTFFHWSGTHEFTPDKWDKIFGEWITLPNEKEV